jgi:hypothetical protein
MKRHPSFPSRTALTRKFLFHPFAITFAMLAFCGTVRASVDLGLPSEATPYDRYFEPVRKVLGKLDGRRQPSMEEVRKLMREGFGFHYSMTKRFVPSSPETTEKRRAGDCKDVALWLANRIDDPNIRFVVGKARSNSAMKHAWLLWRHDDRWWILDCIGKWQPVAAEKVGTDQYIPFYSYSRDGVFKHEAVLDKIADSPHRATPGA